MKFSPFSQMKLGSHFQTRAREGGASVSSVSSFVFSIPPSVRPKVLRAKPKQAGKKGGGWGEGIFARLLPFPSRPRKNMAEGGFGGNSAVFLRKIEASPATLQFIARHHRKILFSLEEKEIRRAQNEKSKEYFSVVWRACRAVAGLASLLGVLRKMGSNFFKQTPLFVGCVSRRRIVTFIAETLAMARVLVFLACLLFGCHCDRQRPILPG